MQRYYGGLCLIINHDILIFENYPPPRNHPFFTRVRTHSHILNRSTTLSPPRETNNGERTRRISLPQTCIRDVKIFLDNIVSSLKFLARLRDERGIPLPANKEAEGGEGARQRCNSVRGGRGAFLSSRPPPGNSNDVAPRERNSSGPPSPSTWSTRGIPRGSNMLLRTQMLLLHSGDTLNAFVNSPRSRAPIPSFCFSNFLSFHSTSFSVVVRGLIRWERERERS